MTLAFSTHWPRTMPKHMAGNPTRFPEKIWQSFDEEYTLDHISEYDAGFDFIGYSWNVDDIGMRPKKHTIRRDLKNRWKAVNNIHFVINNRTKNRFQFAPVIKCTGTQKIEILNLGEESDVPMSYCIEKDDNGRLYDHCYAIWIDEDKLLNQKETEQLAINDGFDSLEDFFSWFNEDFTGKIIHWTNFRY